MSSASARRRAVGSLFAGVGVSAIGFIAVVTVIPLVAEDFLGGPRWSGAPSALVVVGTALGTSWLSAIMARHGRRRGLLAGYLVAAVAALAAAVCAGTSSFALLAASVFVLGVGYAASRLSRYAAADFYDPERRGSAIGWVVWAGTIGSVAGPLLLEPSGRVTSRLGLPVEVGPFLLASLAFTGAFFLLLLYYPSTEQARTSPEPVAKPSVALPRLSPRSGFAVLALVMGQVVMVLLMTMTPIHIRSEGRGLAAIGFVFAAHTFGMYALSPLCGYLSDRLGRLPMIVVAGAALTASGLIAGDAGADPRRLTFALFLLGLGWNLGFVAASALLTDSVSGISRVRLQGLADSLIWSSAAAAGVLSGVLLSSVGYDALCRIGSFLAVVPSAALAIRYRSLVAAAPTPGEMPQSSEALGGRRDAP